MSQIQKSQWIDRFAARLCEIQPGVPGKYAMGLALANALHSDDVKQAPENVAEAYALAVTSELPSLSKH